MDKSIHAYQLEIASILAKNDPKTDWNEVLKYYQRQLANFQMERLIHLIVTVVFALVAIITVLFSLYTKNVPVSVVSVLLLLLLLPYIFHYFKLENGVQALYLYDPKIQQKLVESRQLPRD